MVDKNSTDIIFAPGATRTLHYSITGTATNTKGEKFDVLLDIETGRLYLYNLKTGEVNAVVEIKGCWWCRLRKWWRSLW